MPQEQTPFQKFLLFRQQSVSVVISVLREKNLLLEEKKCSNCSEMMVERPKNIQDGRCWTCNNRACVSYCACKSIRNGSFFDDFKIPLIDVFTVIFLWAQDKSFSDIEKDFGVSKATIAKVIAKILQVTVDYFAAVPIRLGGPDIICQCDLFVHKAKYNHGRRPSDQVWVFGIADTSFKPARFYVEIVSQRDSETLFPIIARVCKPNTKIHTDSWAAYHAIQRELGFVHGMVNHKLNFVAPCTGVHTQNVESLWN